MLTSVADALPGEPGQQIRQPNIRDHPGDVVLVFARFTVAHRAGEHRVDQLLDVINLTGRRRVGEDVGPGHGLGEQRIALHRAVEFADHEAEPLIRRPAGQAGAVGLGVDPLEFPAQRRDQQMHFRGEIPVQRADRDVRPVGDRAHLNCLVAALGGDRHRRVQDAFAPLALRLGARARTRPVPPRSSPHEAAPKTRSRIDPSRSGPAPKRKGHLTDSSFSRVLARNDTHAEREFLTSVPPGHPDVLLRWHST